MSEQTGTNWITWVNRLAVFLVSLLAIGAFVLSYNALYEVANSHGIPISLAWIWPLLIDGAIVVFSISVVRASLLREKAWWPWLLVIVFTAGTVFFNILHFVPIDRPLLVSITIAIIAPVGLVLAFETVMGMLKSNVARYGVVQSISQITAKLAELEGLYQGQKDKLESGLDSLERDRLAEIEARATLKRAEVEALVTGQATLQTEVDKASQKLSDIAQQVEEKRRELNTTQDATLINVWDLISHIDKAHLDTRTRQFFVALLTNAKVSQKDISEWAGVTVKTVQRDIQGCNGLIKKVG